MSAVALTPGKRAASPRLPIRIPAAVLLCVGAILCGQGLWIDAKAKLAQILLDRAFEHTLASGMPVKPWRWADTWPVARIGVTRLGVSQIVLDGDSGEALAFGPGQLRGASVPGEPGTTIFAAHRDTHFRFLKQVRVGDSVDVTTRKGRHVRYRVTGARIVRWDEFGISRDGPSSLALVTCWPFDAAGRSPLRYVVMARSETG